MTTRTAFLAAALPAAALGLSVSAADLEPLDLHGTASQGAIVSRRNNFIEDSRDGSFDFREYGLNATWAATDKLTVGGQVFGREFGSVGNDRLYLDWLSVEFAWRDWLGMRAGKLKVPNGLYGETRDIDTVRTPILLPQGVYMEYIRDSYNATWGADAHGFIPHGRFGGLSYLVQGGSRSYEAHDGERTRLLSRRGMAADDIEARASVAAALTWHTPINGLRLATTWSWDESDTVGSARSPLGLLRFRADTDDQLAWIVSAEYIRGPLTLAIEGLSGSFDSRFTYYPTRGVPAMDYCADYSGAYAQADWRFTPRFTTAVGLSHFDYNQSIAMQGMPGTQVARESQRDGYLSLRFDLTDNLLLKIEEHIVSGSAGVFPLENPEGVSDHWSMTLAKVTFVF